MFKIHGIYFDKIKLGQVVKITPVFFDIEINDVSLRCSFRSEELAIKELDRIIDAYMTLGRLI